jgi:cyclic pyranopterin monophosphate synthase
MTDRLTHVGSQGEARMVDVSGKSETLRTARASGTIRMAAETLAAIRSNLMKKGDVLGVARIAGIMAAKRTSDLVPLCHPLPLDDVQVSLTIDESIPGIRAEVQTRTTAKTGVEMEAIVAVSISLITVYDMEKAMDRGLTIGAISLDSKTGGSGGDWTGG